MRTVRPAMRWTLGLLAACLVLGPSLPHFHAASPHAREICAGHLSHDGAPGLDHGGSCLRCRTVRRDRLSLPGAGATVPADLVDPRGPVAALPARAVHAPSLAGVPPRGPPLVSTV